MNQQELDIKTEGKTPTNVSDFRFAPIKGQPMLQWRGKRPFTSTSYFPAQEKEQHGEEVDGWLNKIFWGDNIQVMSHLLKEYRGDIKCVYIDPPFDSKADYKKKIQLRGKKIETDNSSFEEKQYGDIWTNDEYLQFMYERLVLIRELLAEDGSIYVHCDYHKSHHLRCLLDEIFGIGSAGDDKNAPGFRGELVWDKGFRGTESKDVFQRTHDIVFWYSKTSKWIWNQQFEEYTDKKMGRYNQTDENGRKYALIKRVRTDGSIYYGKCYYNENGKKIEDVIFIPIMASTDSERLDYPTQKPEELVQKFIAASSNPGDIVFDCFMGSGTTQAVAMQSGRRFIGADINLGAIQTTTKRLINVAAELNKELPDPEHPKYTGFSVYNVNNYDVFRNPIEAKDILVQALELEPLPGNTVYDGLDEDWYVKIMPVNRIATREDLNEIEANFPIKEAEKFKEEHPNKVFQKIRLVCMGHEPALDAELKKVIPYNIEVEILDILRDKSDLRFKRDAEAKIRRTKKKLVIEKFYPMNLMEKLSMQKEKVKDWREMVESVMIDFNYDGSVFTPTVTDIPEKDEFVKGEYDIPEDAGTIRVKITDLLSESLEQEVS